MPYATSSPAATTGGPVCQNCTTSTTPLWRRDENGSVLCNACGLFLKLHGTPRPISLKTDVIKSRNRVKTSGQQGQKRKTIYEGNGLPASQSEPNMNALNNSAALHKTSADGSDPSNSPVSRTVTPAVNHPSNIAPQHMFDGVSLADHTFQSPAIASLQPRQPSPGSSSSMTDRHLEPPQSYEGLLQANTVLKTRVSELEVVNGLYQSHVKQYELGAAGAAPKADMLPRDSEAQLRHWLQQSQQREDALKRQVEDLEREVAELRGDQPPAKRTRVEETTPEYPEPPQSFASNGLHT